MPSVDPAEMVTTSHISPTQVPQQALPCRAAQCQWPQLYLKEELVGIHCALVQSMHLRDIANMVVESHTNWAESTHICLKDQTTPLLSVLHSA